MPLRFRRQGQQHIPVSDGIGKAELRKAVPIRHETICSVPSACTPICQTGMDTVRISSVLFSATRIFSFSRTARSKHAISP